MRLHVSFAVLTLALLAVLAWVAARDAFPEWRRDQRVLVRREIGRLEAGLDSARATLARPEVRYELERLDVAIRAAAADTGARAAELAALRARLAVTQRACDGLRVAIRDADARLREPARGAARDTINLRLERVQQTIARVSGTWPPDTSRLSRLWVLRDSLAGARYAIEGPAQRLRDSLLVKQTETQDLRIAAARLTSTRDSLEARRARLLEPVTAREAALERLKRQPARVREIVSADGDEVARCPTCHGEMDDSPGAHPALPAMEVFREVPCTVCHHGHGRALRRKDAHRGLLTAGEFSAGPNSVRARIDRLASPDANERERAREELWDLTGVDPLPERAGVARRADEDASIAAAWAEWWRGAAPYFEPGEKDGGERNALLAAGVDPWRFSSRGRPLRYLGSEKCLACHETLHREHSRRWLATKFRSIERLVDEPHPERCYPCHTTGYDAATGRYAEPGVTCEGCHGPGERYNEMMRVGQELIGKGEEQQGRALLDLSSRIAREAVNQRTVPGDRGPVNVCVSCHHPWEHREGGPGTLEMEPRGPTPKVKGVTIRPTRGG